MGGEAPAHASDHEILSGAPLAKVVAGSSRRFFIVCLCASWKIRARRTMPRGKPGRGVHVASSLRRLCRPCPLRPVGSSHIHQSGCLFVKLTRRQADITHQILAYTSYQVRVAGCSFCSEVHRRHWGVYRSTSTTPDHGPSAARAVDIRTTFNAFVSVYRVITCLNEEGQMPCQLSKSVRRDGRQRLPRLPCLDGLFR